MKNVLGIRQKRMLLHLKPMRALFHLQRLLKNVGIEFMRIYITELTDPDDFRVTIQLLHLRIYMCIHNR